MQSQANTTIWLQLGLASSVVGSSIWTFQKYLGNIGLICCVLIGFSVVLVGYRYLPLHLLATLQEKHIMWLTAATFALLIGIFAMVYPFANAGIVGGGTDRDEALNIAVTEMLHGRYPYYPRTYLNAPISPLPGAILLATPFVMLGNSAYQNIFWLFCFVIGMRLYLKSGISALLLLWIILALSPIVWNEFVTGGDLLANNIYILLFVVGMLNAVFALSSGGKQWVAIAASVLLGIGLSSRSNFFLIIPLIFSSLVQHAGIKKACIYTAISCIVCIAITLPFYLYDPAGFSPLTTFGKVDWFDSFIPFAGLLVSSISVVLTLGLSLQRMDSSHRVLLRNIALVQAFPVLFVIVATSIISKGTINQLGWYGLNFLFFGAVAAWGGLHHKNKHIFSGEKSRKEPRSC